MMIPPKLTHGDTLANLFEKFNTVIDYLREIRLVAGNGIRINHLASGTTIESTATSSATGVSQAQTASVSGPFDVEAVYTETEENPVWKILVYNSKDETDSGIAGLLIIGSDQYPVNKISLDTPDGWSYLYLDVIYDVDSGQYSYEFKITDDYDIPTAEDREYIEVIALLKKSNGIPIVSMLRPLENITVTGRWI